MNIGKEKRTIRVEPMRIPIPQRQPVERPKRKTVPRREPAPSAPVRTPVKAPARKGMVIS